MDKRRRWYEFDDSYHSEESENPMELFLKFFEEVMILFISNNYALQKNNTPNVDDFEIKSFIGVLLLRGYK